MKERKRVGKRFMNEKGISRWSCAGVRASVWRRKFSADIFLLLDRNLALHSTLVLCLWRQLTAACGAKSRSADVQDADEHESKLFSSRFAVVCWDERRMNGAKTAETKIALQTFRKSRKSASFVRDNWVIRREQFVNYSIHSLSLLSDNGSNYKLRTQFSYRLALRIFESRFLAACNSLIYGFSYRLITFTDSTKPLRLEMQSISLLFNLFLLGSHNIRPTNNSPMFSYERHSIYWHNVSCGMEMELNGSGTIGKWNERYSIERVNKFIGMDVERLEMKRNKLEGN